MIDIAQRAIERNSMIEIQIRETDEFIKLGQALKKAGLVESGVDAKFVIQDGLVKSMVKQNFSVEKKSMMVI